MSNHEDHNLIFPAVKTSNLMPLVFFTYSYFYCLYFWSSRFMESLLDSLQLLATPFHVTVIVSARYPRMCFTCTVFISSPVTLVYADNNCTSWLHAFMLILSASYIALHTYIHTHIHTYQGAISVSRQQVRNKP